MPPDYHQILMPFDYRHKGIRNILYQNYTGLIKVFTVILEGQTLHNLITV